MVCVMWQAIKQFWFRNWTACFDYNLFKKIMVVDHLVAVVGHIML